MRFVRVVLPMLMWMGAVAATPTSQPTVQATPRPEPSPSFGRVVYRAARVAGFESLGITMIACRHRDAEVRRFAVQFFDPDGRTVSMLGTSVSPPVPAGTKVVFVTDGMPFANRPDVANVRLGHLSIGTARVVSDARVVHCVGKMRMDAGRGTPSYRDEIGLVRDGAPLPELSRIWKRSPYAAPHR